MRFLGYNLADESVEMPPPTPALMERMGAFMEEATKARVLVATGGIAPTAMAGSGRRVHEASRLAQNARDRQLLLDRADAVMARRPEVRLPPASGSG